MTKENSMSFWSRKLDKRFEKKSAGLFINFINWLSKKLKLYCWYITHPKAEHYSYYDCPRPESVFVALKINKLRVHELIANDYFHKFQTYLERTYKIYRKAGYFQLFDENGYFFEKALEHYLSIELLNISQDDIVLDAGSWGSPFAVIAERERM